METPSTLKSVTSIKFISDRIETLKNCVLSDEELPTLWVGAGISAKYAEYPTWRAFLDGFLANHFVAASEDYKLIRTLIDLGKFDIAVELFTRTYERDFYAAISRSFSSNRHALPAFFRSWGFRDIITTNYDRLIEGCFVSHDIVLPSSGIDALMSSRPKVIKIHGTADQTDTCVASISHYIRNYDNNLQWYLSDVFLNRSVIFIGSSMNSNEAFLETLKKLRNSGRLQRRHHCVLAVSSRAEAKQQGKRLEPFGISVIPYFPGRDHRFLDELFGHINGIVSSRNECARSAKKIRNLAQQGHFSLACVLIQYSFMKEKPSESVRLQLADSLYVINRQFISVSGFLEDTNKEIILRDIANSVLSMKDSFVRKPRMLKSLYRLIKDRERFDNQSNNNLTEKLWKYYYEQKQQWRIEKPSEFEDGIP